MMRMLKMELTVSGQYLRQLAFSILFMAVCFTVGMGSTSMLPGIIFMMGSSACQIARVVTTSKTIGLRLG